jgi:hypothetical protein
MKRNHDSAYDPQSTGSSGDPEGELDGEDASTFGEPNRSLSFDARTRHSFLAEDDDRSESNDDNLSDLFASMGVEERLDELGL